MFQELGHLTALAAASLVGVASIGNALGRVFWAGLSDTVTRRIAFLLIFLVQIPLFWFYPHLHSGFSLGLVTFVILMCYGGGFGTMPAFAADYFGAKNVGPIYGLMLTAWGAASVFGPLLIAHMREADKVYSGALHIIAAVLAVSLLLPFAMRPPPRNLAPASGPILQ